MADEVRQVQGAEAVQGGGAGSQGQGEEMISELRVSNLTHPELRHVSSYVRFCTKTQRFQSQASARSEHHDSEYGALMYGTIGAP